MKKKITLISVPKPLINPHVRLIQENALASWSRLNQTRVVIASDDTKVKAMAKKYGARVMEKLDVNEEGTPYLDKVIQRAGRLAAAEVMVYVNADIMLMNDFIEAIRAVDKERFLLVGRRTDLWVKKKVSFDHRGLAKLRQSARKDGELRRETAIDYFAFTPEIFAAIPPLLVGRAWFDNCLVYLARRRGAVIDATQAVLAIHQNHDYAHHRQGKTGVYEGSEALYNKKLAGDGRHYATIRDASHVLVRRGDELKLRLKLLTGGEEFKYFWFWTWPRISPWGERLMVPVREWLERVKR